MCYGKKIAILTFYEIVKLKPRYIHFVRLTML